MDDRKFDELVKSLNTVSSRRTTLRTALAGSLAAGLGLLGIEAAEAGKGKGKGKDKDKKPKKPKKCAKEFKTCSTKKKCCKGNCCAVNAGENGQDICAPKSDFNCCSLANGGGACPVEFGDCCPPNPSAELGACCIPQVEACADATGNCPANFVFNAETGCCEPAGGVGAAQRSGSRQKFGAS